MSNNAHELSNRLLNALDNNYNVVDMHTVNEIISILEKFNITKELLETTRLGKHVNELRRKTTDPTLARRAKVLVKRWRDLVIPTVASPGHTGSNRSSAERNVRRLGGTPLTSPALSLHRQVVSPAVQSPRPPSRPAWGGYESDSQDVILVDDDPPPPPPPPALVKPSPPPVKRPPSPEPLYDDKKAKRDKKPKKRRGHSRAGTGAETGSMGVAPPPGGAPPPAPAPSPAADPWRDRNGTERRRNGCRTDTLDPYTALVNRMPPAGAKKVKTTKELLEEIQSRGVKPPASPASPHSPDVMLIEPDPCPLVKVESPLRNGTRAPSPLPPLEEWREERECTCGAEGEGEADCAARRAGLVLPLHVAALHHAYLPGVNGTRAPRLPHQYAVRRAQHPDTPGLFASVVPLYKYSDYADDGLVKNMSRVPLCPHLPWTQFAPDPPPPPPPPSPPPLRPYPLPESSPAPAPVKAEPEDEDATDVEEEEPPAAPPEVVPEMVGVPCLELGERLKAPLLSPEEETQFPARPEPPAPALEVQATFETKPQEHRTVERTKGPALDGRALHAACVAARDAVPYDYAQFGAAPVLTLPEAPVEAEAALAAALEAAAEPERDALGRPLAPPNFTEWHESARLGELIALPYVVID